MTFEDAIRKAKYGHRDWIVWRGKDGKLQAFRKSPESVKRCLLDTGTQGKWTLVSANDGVLMVGRWWLGINLLAHMKRGVY